MFTTTDGGVGKNEMIWKLGNPVSTETRKLKILYFSNVNGAETVKLSEVIRNPWNFPRHSSDYISIFDKPAIRIDAVDERLITSLYVTLQQELIEAEDTVERTRLRDIPKLLEWKTHRGGPKRGRSVSR